MGKRVLNLLRKLKQPDDKSFNHSGGRPLFCYLGFLAGVAALLFWEHRPVWLHCPFGIPGHCPFGGAGQCGCIALLGLVAGVAALAF